MSNTVTNVFAIGISGLTLRGQLYTALNAASGGEFTPSYYERPGTNGIYAVTLTTADGFQGYCDVYANGASTQILGTIAINPQEVENADIKTSNVWSILASALTVTGSIGKWIVDKLDAAITSRMATFVYTAPDNAMIATRASQASVDALPSASVVLDAIKAYEVETGHTFDDVLKRIYAVIRGEYAANDPNSPTELLFYAPDGTTVRVTFAFNADGTTRTPS